METLTRQHEAAPAEVETPPEAPAETPAPSAPCATCGASMEPGQEWCLECGTARADRLAAPPAWRNGAAVLVVTGVLVAGAAAAAWAGLSADAKRVAASDTQAAAPAATQPPPAAAPAQPPAAAPAQPPAAAKKSSTKPPPAAKTPATPSKAATPAAPVTPPASTPSSSTQSSDTETTPAQHSKPVAKLQAVTLADDAAVTYNPYNRGGAESADPKLTTDGDKATAWTANVDPSAAGKSAIGVNVNLKKLTGLRALDLSTPTPGMTVEIYGAKGADAPVSVQDPDWTHITTQLDVAKSGRVRLGSGKAQYRHLLIWITEAAPQGDKVSLGELKLFA